MTYAHPNAPIVLFKEFIRSLQLEDLSRQEIDSSKPTARSMRNEDLGYVGTYNRVIIVYQRKECNFLIQGLRREVSAISMLLWVPRRNIEIVTR